MGDASSTQPVSPSVAAVIPSYVLQRRPADAHGTTGELFDATGARICVTLEPPPNGNQHDVSSIPAGDYLWERRWSPKHECEVFGALNVPGDREDVEFHPGCLWPRDTKGCVLTGTTFGHVNYDDGKPNAEGEGILGAKTAFARFMNLNSGCTHIRVRIVDPVEATADGAPTRVDP
jgi:hypothetical protein